MAMSLKYAEGNFVSLGENSTSLMAKNLQVVSFDSDWKEVYLGTVRRDSFNASCPANDGKVNVKYAPKEATSAILPLTAAKWCPLDNCTVLVVASKKGIQFYDWNGQTRIFEYDFAENGIGVDDRLVNGAAGRGIAAVGPNYVAVGIHTGTVVLFEVATDEDNFICRVVDSQRSHSAPCADLASTALTTKNGVRDILVSGDVDGVINVWALGDARGDGLVHKNKIDEGLASGAVTTLSLWNRDPEGGMAIVGFASGLIRTFRLLTGDLLSEISAHATWITGMDLASQSGLLVTTSEDGFVRVWQLSPSGSGRLVVHKFCIGLDDAIPTGIKFLDPKGGAFAVSVYDSSKISVFAKVN